MVVSAKQKKQAAAKDEGGGGGEKEEALLLTKGAVVEVSTEEDGFKDAWFVATIIKPPQRPPTPRPGPKSSNSESPNHSRLQEVYVEYKTLLNDKHPSKPLREHVHVRLVRPLPPPTDHTPSFELYDVVDAFYRDGWWTGVITRLLPGPIFVVTFRNPPHEIHFAFSDLRLHLDWVNNTWVRPIKQKMPGIMYSVGKKVEVLLENDDVWFPATIIEDSGSASFLVEYHTPDEPHSRKVTIDYTRIRPCPPLIKDKGFELLEKVDALSEYGWRAGLVTQELEGNRYKVFFKGTNIAKELSHSEIRPPLRWQDEKWFTVSGDVIIPQQDKPEGLVQSNIDVTNGSINISDGKKSKESQNQNQEKKESEESLESSAKKRTRYPTNEKSNKGGEGVDTIIRSLIASQKKTNTSAKQMASDFESPPSNSTRSNLLRARRTTVDNSINPSPGTADTERKRRKIVEDDYITTPISKTTTPGGSANLLTKKRRSSLGSKDKDKEGTGSGGQVVEKEKEKEKEKECSPKEADISIIIGLECVKTIGSKTDGGAGGGGGDEILKLKVDQKQQMNDESSVDNKESGGVGESSQSQKRPRGRPKKVLIKSLSLDNTITEQNGNNKVNKCITGNGEELEKENGEKEIAASAEPAAGPIKKLERYSSKRSKRRMTSVNQQDNPSDVSGGGGNNTDSIITKEVNTITTTTSVVVDEKATNEDDMMDDDQPLAKWFEDKMHSPPPAPSAPSAPEGTTSTKFSSPSVDQSNDLITKKNKSVPVVDQESTKQVDKNVVISNEPEREPEPEPENLPFVKNTTLWATVENMEAFQKIPQKPHFRPLLKCKESSREGLAIASMVTFAGAVVNISKLRFDDPRDKIEDILDSLNDLETHGFDVTLLRDGIANLLSIIDRTQKINGDVMDINSKIVAYKMDKANKDEEIVEMKKQIKELQEKIVLAESVKEIKDAEIALLQKKLLDLDESLSTSRATFDEIAGGVLRGV